jgi:hypothetical protein
MTWLEHPFGHSNTPGKGWLRTALPMAILQQLRRVSEPSSSYCSTNRKSMPTVTRNSPAHIDLAIGTRGPTKTRQ